MTADAWFAGGERVIIELGGERFEIFYRIGGAGPWLTALHGFPTSSWDWAKVVPDLEPRFRVLCFDFLGFGDSDKPRAHRYSIFEQADLTEALWRALGVEQTAVVAHDYGATVAQELLARSELTARVTSVTLPNAAVYVRLARPLVIQRLLAGRLTGPIVARAVTERTFRRSFESIFSEGHPIGEAEIHEHWRVLERRGGSVRCPTGSRTTCASANSTPIAGRPRSRRPTARSASSGAWPMSDRAPASPRRSAGVCRSLPSSSSQGSGTTRSSKCRPPSRVRSTLPKQMRRSSAGARSARTTV